MGHWYLAQGPSVDFCVWICVGGSSAQQGTPQDDSVGTLHKGCHNGGGVWHCVCEFVLGAFRRCFTAVEALRKKIKVEAWVVPYARYELGMLWLRQDTAPPPTAGTTPTHGTKAGTKRGLAKLRHVNAKKGDYAWDLQLSLRIHLVFHQYGHPYEDTMAAVSIDDE
eukprot:m.1491054 g.1491054  ORF g.1491054 m.1491054 type:complete len:166 (+) comp25191_c0_seq39:76-573(+)